MNTYQLSFMLNDRDGTTDVIGGSLFISGCLVFLVPCKDIFIVLNFLTLSKLCLGLFSDLLRLLGILLGFLHHILELLSHLQVKIPIDNGFIVGSCLY